VNASLWQTPQACTLMRTCPLRGSGIVRSTIWKFAPGLGTCATFIVPTSTAVVAIDPPLHFQIWDWKSLAVIDQNRGAKEKQLDDGIVDTFVLEGVFGE
jgi:hypothetical protein